MTSEGSQLRMREAWASEGANQNWYSLEHLPAGRLYVRVIWALETLEVARMVQPRTGQLAWCRIDGDGAVEWLPPKHRTGQRWPAEPSCWQPIDAAVWTWPGGREPPALPVHAVPRLWSSRQRFGAVDEAEAADLAREMEADREDAKRGSVGTRSANQRGQRRGLWWLDATGLRYDPPGSVTRRDAEARLMRALACDGWLSHFAAGAGLHQSQLLGRLRDQFYEAALRKLAEIEARHPPDLVPTVAATPADHDDFLTASAWFNALGCTYDEHRQHRRLWGAGIFAPLTDQQRLLALASRPSAMSWGDIGHVLDISRQAAQQGYSRAIDLVARIANGHETQAARSHREALEAVRAGNRAARMRA